MSEALHCLPLVTSLNFGRWLGKFSQKKYKIVFFFKLWRVLWYLYRKKRNLPNTRIHRRHRLQLVPAEMTLEFSKTNSGFRDPKRLSVNQQPIPVQSWSFFPGSVDGWLKTLRISDFGIRLGRPQCDDRHNCDGHQCLSTPVSCMTFHSSVMVWTVMSLKWERAVCTTPLFHQKNINNPRSKNNLKTFRQFFHNNINRHLYRHVYLWLLS